LPYPIFCFRVNGKSRRKKYDFPDLALCQEVNVSDLTVSPVTWKQIAFQKVENLRTGASGEPERVVAQVMQTTLYEAKNGSVDIVTTQTGQKVNVLV